MKIAFIANTSWSMVNFRKGVLATLVKEGHEVWILAPQDQYSSYFEPNGINFQKLELSQYGNNIFRELAFLKSLYQITREQKFDLIFNFTLKLNLYSTLIAKFLSIPCIMIVTGLGYYSIMSRGVKKSLIFCFHKLSATLADQLWVLNSHDRNYFSKKVKINSNKIRCLNGEGINLNHFQRQSEKYPATVTFLFAARLIQEKGIYQYIAAIRDYNQKVSNKTVHFKIAGFLCPNYPNAVSKAEIDQWVQEGLVTYVGNKSDIRPEIEAASCLVLPSYYGEGMSRIIMESLAMKVPVITTYNKGCEELIIHEKTGYLIEKKNVSQLVEAFEFMASLNAQQLKTMGNYCRMSIIKTFDEELIIEQYLNTVRQFDKSTVNLKKQALNQPKPKSKIRIV